MHQVEGDKNKEIMAFIAASISYGSRKQFLPKIQFILDSCNGNIYDWVYSGDFKNIFPDSNQCFYRLYTYATMRKMLTALQEMLNQHDTIKDFVGNGTCLDALEKITKWFATRNVEGIIPAHPTNPVGMWCKY